MIVNNFNWYLFNSFRDDEPKKLPSSMNSRIDRTASPARKGSIPTARIQNSKLPDISNLVNNGSVINNRPVSEFHHPPSSMSMDAGGNNATENKTTLKIHLVDGGFNVVKCSDTTDIKVSISPPARGDLG